MTAELDDGPGPVNPLRDPQDRRLPGSPGRAAW